MGGGREAGPEGPPMPPPPLHPVLVLLLNVVDTPAVVVDDDEGIVEAGDILGWPDFHWPMSFSSDIFFYIYRSIVMRI